MPPCHLAELESRDRYPSPFRMTASVQTDAPHTVWASQIDGNFNLRLAREGSGARGTPEPDQSSIVGAVISAGARRLHGSVGRY